MILVTKVTQPIICDDDDVYLLYIILEGKSIQAVAIKPL
jgi:hypothetical protein